MNVNVTCDSYMTVTYNITLTFRSKIKKINKKEKENK